MADVLIKDYRETVSTAVLASLGQRPIDPPDIASEHYAEYPQRLRCTAEMIAEERTALGQRGIMRLQGRM